MGIRSPPGLNTDTGQPSGARNTGQDSPPGTGSPPGLARKLRLLLGMTRSQGPSQSPSATPPLPRQGGRRLEWPPRPLQEPPAPDESPWTRPTRYIKTVPEGKTRLKNGTPGHNMWIWSTGLGSAAAGRHWVSSGLGIATAGGGYLPRSAGMRACSQWTRLPRETNKQEQNKN